jgi:hypothetical protein
LLFDIIWSELQPLKIERKHSASDLGKLSEWATQLAHGDADPHFSHNNNGFSPNNN